MPRERTNTESLSFQIDEALQNRVADYRFKERIGSENEAARRLLRAGMKAYAALLDKDLLKEADALLKKAVKGGHRGKSEPQGKFSQPKRLYMDQELARGIAEYRRDLRLTSDSHAVRSLLQLGLGATQEDLVAEAKFYLQIAYNRSLARVELLFAAAIEGSEDPEEILTAKDGLFDRGGKLKLL